MTDKTSNLNNNSTQSSSGNEPIKERTTIGKWSTALGTIAPVAAISAENTLLAVAATSATLFNVAVQAESVTAPSEEQIINLKRSVSVRNDYKSLCSI